MSFFQGYRATEGLNQFPQDHQFYVWRAADKRLKKNDPIYRAQCRKFVLKILATSLIFVTIVIAPDLLQKAGIIPGGVGVDIGPYFTFWFIFPAMVGLLATAVYLPCVLFASFREQARRNVKVAEEIKKLPTAT